MESISFEATRIIDIAAVCSGPERKTDRAIAEALVEHGAFVATGFDNAEGLAGQMADLLSFFAMPETDKLACATCRYVPQNPNNYRGFYPLPKRKKWSHNETFDVGPQPTLASPNVSGADSFREPNAWPRVEPVPNWRQRVLAMAVLQRELAVLLMAALARGLGLDEEVLVAPSRGRNSTLRLLHYAPAPADFSFASYDDDESEDIGDGRRLLARSHVDTGLLALLWQDAAGGLQMQGADGVWREVPPVADGLSVHCANLLEPLTKGVLCGTLHRVVGRGGDRCSVGVWLEPDFETEIVEPGGTSPVSYAQHLVNEFPDRFVRQTAASSEGVNP